MGAGSDQFFEDNGSPGRADAVGSDGNGHTRVQVLAVNTAVYMKLPLFAEKLHIR